MRKSLAAALVLTIGSFAMGATAQAVTLTPYPNPGTPNPDVYVFSATSTGDVFGFFAGVNAADNSVVGVSINGAAPIIFGLSNQSSVVGQSVDFGHAVAGDTLTFIFRNLTTGTQFSSVASANPDGLQHAFATRFAGSGGIPTGVQISFEDLARLQGSDFDYNDSFFVFTNVANLAGGVASANPIPAALPLFATGFGVLGGIVLLRRRKLSREA